MGRSVLEPYLMEIALMLDSGLSFEAVSNKLFEDHGLDIHPTSVNGFCRSHKLRTKNFWRKSTNKSIPKCLECEHCIDYVHESPTHELFRGKLCEAESPMRAVPTNVVKLSPAWCYKRKELNGFSNADLVKEMLK